jgi:hypothetical protein
MIKPKPKYCDPWNVGLASDSRAVARRIARILTTLEREITRDLVRGKITDDISTLKRTMIESLRAEGWTIHYSYTTHKYQVRRPK